MVIIVKHGFRRKGESQQDFLTRCLIESGIPHPTVTVNGILLHGDRVPETVDDECLIMIQ